jgi:hypothetical protein
MLPPSGSAAGKQQAWDEAATEAKFSERRNKIGEGAMMGSLTKNLLAISLTYF